MTSPNGPDRPAGQKRLPRNRFRLLVILTFVAILVIVFGYLILVGNRA